jgi:hypothetical protein
MSVINYWLNLKISKYSDCTNKEYLDNVYSLLIDFINKNDNLVEKYYRKQMKYYFYIFIFNKNLFDNNSCDIIDMNFTSDIVDLYFTIKDTYGVELLEKQNIKVDDLLIFLNEMTYFYEEEKSNDEDEIIHADEILM